jgi:hypothetical protein
MKIVDKRIQVQNIFQPHRLHRHLLVGLLDRLILRLRGKMNSEAREKKMGGGHRIEVAADVEVLEPQVDQK